MGTKLKIAIVFGGKSSEHEVSIITSLQAWQWLDEEKYDRYLLYLDRDNNAFLCPSFKQLNYQKLIKDTLEKNDRINWIKHGFSFKEFGFTKNISLDTVILATHGTYGEDGCLQGLLEIFDIPYTSAGVLGSALGMDKIITKHLFKALGLPYIPYIWFKYDDYLNNKDNVEKNTTRLGFPVFVKPANGGSSVGITKVDSTGKLQSAIKEAGRYSQRIIVERAMKGIDINCAVMGSTIPNLKTTVCEQPLTGEKFLTFKDKYLKGGKIKGMAGLSRIVPAPIPRSASEKIKKFAILIYKEFNFSGNVRIDFLYQPKTGDVYPGEANTIPGSLALYLWEASDFTKKELIEVMIKEAINKNCEEKTKDLDYKSDILNQK